MKDSTTEGYTYILERKPCSVKDRKGLNDQWSYRDAKLQRRFYVGRTIDLQRRMKEHSKDRYKDYVLIWYVYGQYEKKVKKFGAVLFVECLREGILSETEK